MEYPENNSFMREQLEQQLCLMFLSFLQSINTEVATNVAKLLRKKGLLPRKRTWTGKYADWLPYQVFMHSFGNRLVTPLTL
jgi:hypothetical protein